MISYSSRDREFAADLHSFLLAEGVDILYDDSFADAGERVTAAIDDMIRLAQVLIVVLSHHSIASTWVQYELSLFLARRKLDPDLLIIPILLVPCGLPRDIEDLVVIDFTSPMNHSEAKRTLLRRLRAHQEPTQMQRAPRVPLTRPSTFQRGELESLVAQAVDRGMRRMQEDLGAIVQIFQKHQHLMTPDVISRRERAVVSEVWVVTTDLHNDLYDKNIQASVRSNFERQIDYTYFLPPIDFLKQRQEKYEAMYVDFSKYWRFITLPAGVFMPFDEVVIYDARSVAHMWGYAQMKYVVEGRQDDDLFLKLPDRNIVAMAESLRRILEPSGGR